MARPHPTTTLPATTAHTHIVDDIGLWGAEHYRLVRANTANPTERPLPAPLKRLHLHGGDDERHEL